MILATLATGLVYFFSKDAFDVKEQPAGAIYYTSTPDPRNATAHVKERFPAAQVTPMSEKAFKNIVKQQYDYSCGSAALTTLLNGFMGEKLNEKQVLDGMLKYGEYEKIISRRSFSLLDMKRYVNTLGFDSGGFKGSIKDLIELNQPAIVPIDYAGSKHFVVVKAIKDGRIFLADPSAGNISFTLDRFAAIWDNNTLYKITPSGSDNLLALEDADLRHVDDGLLNEEYSGIILDREFKMEQLRDRYSTIKLVRDVDKDSPTYNQYIYQPLRIYRDQ